MCIFSLVLTTALLFYPCLEIICPSGYKYQAGEKMGARAEIKTYDKTNIEECAHYCNGNSKCKSIEWSDFQQKCILLMVGSTDGPQLQDYRFCSRIVKGN